MPQWGENGARESKHVARITLEWSQSGDRIVPEWGQNGPECVRMKPVEWGKRGRRIMAKLARMGRNGSE